MNLMYTIKSIKGEKENTMTERQVTTTFFALQMRFKSKNKIVCENLVHLLIFDY